MKAAFTALLENIPAFAPVLLLATSDVCCADLPKEVFLSILFLILFNLLLMYKSFQHSSSSSSANPDCYYSGTLSRSLHICLDKTAGSI